MQLLLEVLQLVVGLLDDAVQTLLVLGGLAHLLGALLDLHLPADLAPQLLAHLLQPLVAVSIRHVRLDPVPHAHLAKRVAVRQSSLATKESIS